MPAITALFWDVGGVLLSDAWDHTQRAEVLKQFGLNPAEFQVRHDAAVEGFERGEIGLNEYLQRTIFYRQRAFTLQALRESMFSMSQAKPESLALARRLKQSGKYLMATINNESLELNQYRIKTFTLREIFTLFVSSCFVGLRKPEPAIYRLALQLTQKAPEECCFLDDRPLNLEAAAKLGMQTVQAREAAQTADALEQLGVTA